MDTPMQSFLAGIKFGKASQRSNLAVIPLFHEQNLEPDYLTLAEGMEQKEIFVEEVDESARVSSIMLRNESGKHVLLFEGEELLGAMQNRILNVSIFAAGNSKQAIPVSCVEAGRWGHREQKSTARRFKMADRMHHARGRATANYSVTDSLGKKRGFQSDQSAVWRDIDMHAQRMHVTSRTNASDDLHASVAKTMKGHVKGFKHKDEQIGSLFLVDDEVSGLEIFAGEATHERMFPKLVRSHGLEAIEKQQSRSPNESRDSLSKKELKQKAKKFVNSLQQSWIKQVDGVCLGQNIRFQDDLLTGGALVHDDVVLHICAFAKEPLPGGYERRR